MAGQEERLRALLLHMRTGPVAEHPELANRQHYELPSEFLGLFLGPRRKYSCCLWQQDAGGGLEEAEEAMLELTCERARIADGLRILDLGCGWGSMSLWLAERYPTAAITAVSNSARQRAHIERRASELGLGNLEVLTADVNDFEPEARAYDRVISVEMFEHMRNWRELLRRISTWLADDGELFLHVFSHRTLPYRFEGTWAADRFFTAGLMPSHELLSFFQDDMRIEERWALPGTHYARTLEAWLERLDANSDAALALLCADGREAREARVLLGGWRLFLISTAEIWRREGGNRWMVSQYRLAPRPG